MKTSKPFNIKIGDRIIFLDETDSCFEKNGKYRVLAVNNYGDYPFNEAHQNELAKGLNNPKVITTKDKNNNTFFLTYTDDGFYEDDIYTGKKGCNFDIFDIERRLRKLKLEKLNKK